MQKLLLILLLGLFVVPSSAQDDAVYSIEEKPNFRIYTSEDVGIYYGEMTDEYQKGWKDGYCEGWKDIKGQMALCPNPPIAPIPFILEDDYVSGYNRGFKKGYVDAADENIVYVIVDSTEEVKQNEDYLVGWENGYYEGWKDIKGQHALLPEMPEAPLPYINRNDYVSGYNRGFKKGYIDADLDDDD